MNGVFIQLNKKNAQWSVEKWSKEFQRMNTLGFHQLIIQWSQSNNIKYFIRPDTDINSAKKTDTGDTFKTINTIIKLAGKHKIDLYLGLYHDSGFWEKIKAPPAVVENYIYHLVDMNLKTARQLMPLITEHEVFKGFYIPQEIDDISWLPKERMNILITFLNSLTRELKKINPDGRILTSSFFRGRTSPRYFAKIWSKILSNTSLDTLLLQDGIGSGLVSEHMMKRYFTELSAICRKEKINLWSVIEIFTTIESNAQKFVAASSSIEKIKNQLALAGPLVDNIVAFSYTYLSQSSDTPRSSQLFKDYMIWTQK